MVIPTTVLERVPPRAAGGARVCLASRSPRRAELLGILGVEFEIVVADIDETPWAGEVPPVYVERIAREKAAAVTCDDAVVLAADTCVAVDELIFGKPRDHADARRMLRALSGRWHAVHTAVALRAPGGTMQAVVVSTRVEFAPLDDALIDAYWASGEPADKAGAYGIQGLGGALVTRIEGSYSAVVGLPLAETRALLDGEGVRHALRRA
ncbi:MAG: septum formation inhibitor Maf [Gammaproteobacteria bacterium]|nr:septum formation inhibitor Maf [Gammaproteobacteria bacterium]MCP5200625.1 septum formation inhibitor Maf [Gammaproteobacteria bacterium]